ncbi:MAG TPA: signal peptidase I [Rhodospirillaceae bacterium]|nr:signal peptidase I [Rhodospirillaceae bacterium]
MEEKNPETEKPSTKKDEGFAENVKTMIWAVAIALVIRTFAFEPFNIPSGSMIPTLLVGDYLFVSKLSYGYSSLSAAYGVPLLDGRIFAEEPKRGDVAVFKLPLDTSVDYIKRVIGLPGDTIQVQNNILFINGQAVPRYRDGDVEMPSQNGRGAENYARFVETLPEGASYHVLESASGSELDNTPPFVVPSGHYFMMGDNRDNSLDSRVPASKGGVGYVPFENLVGRADLMFFSLSPEARFWQFWKLPFAIRYSRLFRMIN